MIPEIGHVALVTAFCLSVVQTIVPLMGAAQGKPSWMAVAIPAARAQFAFNLFAFVALSYAFWTLDFSVLYVASNANVELPSYYRLSAVWGAHEGSLLLWSLILSTWTLAVSIFNRALPIKFCARVLGVMGAISAGFYSFMLFTSNPFERLLPAPLDGQDLNPLLQDPGLIVHPPMLYMGYVGLAVPFSFAIAALLDGRLDPAWTRWTRPWTTMAWVFLTAGITLGSWWAYYELGWGGWWFWDPVENASFMPWLVATALIHSLAVTEQRNAFRAWTVLLAIFGFSLSLLGTFLVRSGVLVSVHAFASDPARGLYILVFLALVIGTAFVLYAWRAPTLAGGEGFELLSRETLLLVNNVLLVVASASILLGTLYPLAYDALGLGKLSVGPPYFNLVFIPLTLPLALLAGIGPLTRWRRQAIGTLLMQLWLPAVAAVCLGTLIVVGILSSKSVAILMGVMFALWVALSTLLGIISRLRHKQHKLHALMALPRSFIGMSLAHLGVAVFIVGVSVTSNLSIEKDLRMAPGDTETLRGYEFQFNGVREVDGPNYQAQRGEVVVSRGTSRLATLAPEKRVYRKQTQAMTEAAIDGGLTRDLYVALGEPLGNGAWAVRLYVKPYIRWIWLGGLLMCLGGIVAVSDRRYRLAPVRQKQVTFSDSQAIQGS